MKTPTGQLYSLPIMVELDDLFALRDGAFGWTNTPTKSPRHSTRSIEKPAKPERCSC